MVKIYHRPDPPPPDVDSNRAIRKTDTYLNSVASAGSFQRALVKAQGQEQAVEQAKVDDSGQQQQIESDAHSALGTKATQSMPASQSETNANNKGAELNAVEAGVEAKNVVGAEELAESPEVEGLPDDSTDVDSADEADESAQDAGFAGSATGLDSSAAYQLFENIQQQHNSAQTEPHADSTALGESVNSGQDAAGSVQHEVAHSAAATTASTAASMQSRIDTVSGLSDLIDMLETSSPLSTGNEWTLILEDDGPVSELTLSSDPDGRWNIDLLTSFDKQADFDNEAIKGELIGNLRHQLDTAGISVANIALVDSAKDSGTSNIA